MPIKILKMHSQCECGWPWLSLFARLTEFGIKNDKIPGKIIGIILSTADKKAINIPNPTAVAREKSFLFIKYMCLVGTC